MSEMVGVLIKHPLPINRLLNTPIMMFKNLKEMTYKILLNKMLFSMKEIKFLTKLKNAVKKEEYFLSIVFSLMLLAEAAMIGVLCHVNSVSQAYIEQLENHIEALGVSIEDTDAETDAYQDYYHSW